MNSTSLLSTAEDGALMSFSPPCSTSEEWPDSSAVAPSAASAAAAAPIANDKDEKNRVTSGSLEEAGVEHPITNSNDIVARGVLKSAEKKIAGTDALTLPSPDIPINTTSTTTAAIASASISSTSPALPPPSVKNEEKTDCRSHTLHLPMPLHSIAAEGTSGGSGWNTGTSSTQRSTSHSREGTPSSLVSLSVPGRAERGTGHLPPYSSAGRMSLDGGLNSVTMSSEMNDGSVWIPHHIVHTALPSPAHSVSFSENPMTMEEANPTTLTSSSGEKAVEGGEEQERKEETSHCPPPPPPAAPAPPSASSPPHQLHDHHNVEDGHDNDALNRREEAIGSRSHELVTRSASGGGAEQSPTPPSLPQIFPRFSSFTSPMTGSPERESSDACFMDSTHEHERQRQSQQSERGAFHWSTSLLRQPTLKSALVPSQVRPPMRGGAPSPPPTFILPEEENETAAPHHPRRHHCHLEDGKAIEKTTAEGVTAASATGADDWKRGRPEKRPSLRRRASDADHRQAGSHPTSDAESSDFTLPGSSSSSSDDRTGSVASPILDPSYLFSLSPVQKDAPPHPTAHAHSAGLPSHTTKTASSPTIDGPAPLESSMKERKEEDTVKKEVSSSDGEEADLALFAPVFSFDETSKEVIDNRQQSSPFPSSPGGRQSPSSTGAANGVTHRLKTFSQMEPTTSVNRKKSAVDLLMLASASSAGSGPRHIQASAHHSATGGFGGGSSVSGSATGGHNASPPSLSVAANSSVGTAITASFTRHATNLTRQHHDPTASSVSSNVSVGGILQHGGNSAVNASQGGVSFGVGGTPSFMTPPVAPGIPQRPSFASLGGISPYPESTNSRLSPNAPSAPSYASSSPSPGVEKTVQGSAATIPAMCATPQINQSSSSVALASRVGSRNSILHEAEGSTSGVEAVNGGAIHSSLVSMTNSPNQPFPKNVPHPVSGSNDSSFTLTVGNSMVTPALPSGAFPSPSAVPAHLAPSGRSGIPMVATPGPSHVSERLTDIVAQLPPSKQTAALIFLEGLLSDAAKEGAMTPSPTLSSVVGGSGTLNHPANNPHALLATTASSLAGTHSDFGAVPAGAGTGVGVSLAPAPVLGPGVLSPASSLAVGGGAVSAKAMTAAVTSGGGLVVGSGDGEEGVDEEAVDETDRLEMGSSLLQKQQQQQQQPSRRDRHSIGAGLPSLLGNVAALDFFVPPVPTSSPVENLGGPFPPHFSSPAVESLVQDALSQSVLRNMDLVDPDLFHTPTYPHSGGKETHLPSRVTGQVEGSTASNTTRSRLVSPTTGLPHGVQGCSTSSQSATGVGSSTSRRGGDFMFPSTSPPVSGETSMSTTFPANSKTLAPNVAKTSTTTITTTLLTSAEPSRRGTNTTTTSSIGTVQRDSHGPDGGARSNTTPLSAGRAGSVISSVSAQTSGKAAHASPGSAESPPSYHAGHHSHTNPYSHSHLHGRHTHDRRAAGASPPSPSSLGRTAELFDTGGGAGDDIIAPSSGSLRLVNDTPVAGTSSTTESSSHVSGFPPRRAEMQSNPSATGFSSAYSSPFSSPSTPVGPGVVQSTPSSVGPRGLRAAMAMGQSAPVSKNHGRDVYSLLSSTSQIPAGAPVVIGSKRTSNESSTTTNVTATGAFPPCVAFNKQSSAPSSISASRTFGSGSGVGGGGAAEADGPSGERPSPILSSTSHQPPSIMGSRHWTGRSRQSRPSSSISKSTTPSPDLRQAEHPRRGAVTVPSTPSLGYTKHKEASRRKGGSSYSPRSGAESDGRSSPGSSRFFSMNQSFHSSHGGMGTPSFGVGRGSGVYRENRSSRLSSGQFSPALHSSTEDTDDVVDPSESLRKPASPNTLEIMGEIVVDDPEVLEAELIELRFLVSHYEPFFHLSSSQLDHVINSFQRQVFTKNSLVVEEGGASLSGLILLMTGRLSFESGGKSHGAMTHRLFYGEMELSYDLQRSSTTMRVVSETAIIFFLPREDYNALVVDERKARHKDVSSFVNKIPLFQALSFHVRQLLVKAFSVTRIEEGTFLTTRGKAVDAMFIIITGRVQMKGRRPPNENSSVINGKSGMNSGNSEARSPNTMELTKDSSVTGGSFTRLLKPNSLGSSSTDLPLDYFMEKCPGDIIGEPEFIFKSTALFDAVALTSLQVAKVSGLQFETTVSHTSIHKMKYFISTEKMYDYYQQCPTNEMQHEMNHVTHRQRAMETNKKRETSRQHRRRGTTAPSAPASTGHPMTDMTSKYEEGKTTTSVSGASANNRSSDQDNLSERSSPNGNEARAAMLTDAAMGGYIGSLSTTSETSPSMSSSFSSVSTRSVNRVGGVYRRPRDRHLTIRTPTACFNDEAFPMKTQHDRPPGMHRGSIQTTTSSHHHHHHHTGPSAVQLTGGPISNLGEIIFSGSKNLYRFHADSLDTNGTTLVGVIVDGTIIRWNSVMQKITGFAPTEVIGQSIYHLLSNEESRQRMRSALQLSMQYTGAWQQYVKEELSHQSVFSFRQHTGLYAVGIAFCVVPSLCAGTAQVLLLIGRAAQMRSASHYADDVTRWLQTSLAPQLRVCQDCLVVMDKKKWVVTQDEAVRLHTAIDISMYMVQQFIRFSKLNQESFNQALRPLRLPALMRYFTKEAWSIVKQTNHSFDSNYDAIPQFEVFMEPQKVVEALKGILLDVLRSAQEDTNINVALLITMVDPEVPPEADIDVYEVPLPSRRASLASSATSMQYTPTRTSEMRKNTPLADNTVSEAPAHVEAVVNPGNEGILISEPTVSNTTPVSNSSLNLPSQKKSGSATDPSAPAFPAPPSSQSSVAGMVNNNSGHAQKADMISSSRTQSYSSKTPGSPYGQMGRSPNYPLGVQMTTPQPTLEAMLGLNTPILYQSMNGNLESLCSVRRIRFEMRDSGTPMMKSNVANTNTNHGGSMNHSESSQTPGTPGYCSTKGSCSPTEAHPNFPAKKMNAYRRGQDLEKITPLIADLGGILYGFYSKVMSSNVMRMELPLLLAPGKSGALGEDGEEGEDEVDEQGQAPVGGGTHTVIVADNNRVQTNTLCQILWARQHAVVPVSSFTELMRQMENGVGNILMIDPINLTITQQELDQLRGDNPFDLIIDKAFGMVVVVMVTDWGDWRVQKLLTLKNVIKLPKTGASAQIHIAIQVAEKEAAEIQEERERFDIIRRTFTSAVPNRHKVVRLLGKGSFGDVFEVEDTLTGGKMAMKEMRLSNTVDPDTVVQELLAMTALQHENIIRYFFCEKASDSLLQLYMEVATGGTLKDRVRATGGKGLPLKETIQYLRDTCNGLAYIHSQRYVHRDLKSANLLLDKSQRVKIGDFGTAKKIKPHEQLYRLVGTPQYIAPEVFSANMAEMNGYSFKVDVWSVGCVAMELATGQPPFSHLEQAQGVGIMKYLTELSSEPDTTPLERCHPLLHSFVKQCLQFDPTMRPTADQLLEHELFHHDFSDEIEEDHNVGGEKPSSRSPSPPPSQLPQLPQLPAQLQPSESDDTADPSSPTSLHRGVTQRPSEEDDVKRRFSVDVTAETETIPTAALSSSPTSPIHSPGMDREAAATTHGGGNRGVVPAAIPPVPPVKHTTQSTGSASASNLSHQSPLGLGGEGKGMGIVLHCPGSPDAAQSSPNSFQTPAGLASASTRPSSATGMASGTAAGSFTEAEGAGGAARKNSFLSSSHNNSAFQDMPEASDSRGSVTQKPMDNNSGSCMFNATRTTASTSVASGVEGARLMKWKEEDFFSDSDSD